MNQYTENTFEATSHDTEPKFTAGDLAELFMYKKQINPLDKDLLLMALLGKSHDSSNRNAVKSWIGEQMLMIDMSLTRQEVLELLGDRFDGLLYELSE